MDLVKKTRVFILHHLDQMICVGGSFVIICLVFKFLEISGSDYLFCASLTTEAIIFLLGAFKDNTYIVDNEKATRNNKEETKNAVFVETRNDDFLERKKNVNSFYILVHEIENDLKKVKKKIEILSQEENTKETEQMSIEEEIKILRQEVNVLTTQIKNINSIPQQKKTNTPLQKKRGRGRPRKIYF